MTKVADDRPSAQVMSTATIWAFSTGPPSSRPSVLTVGERPGRPGGEDAGQDRPQRAADAVDAEGVQRIVVPEPRLQRRAGQEADDAHGHAHQQGGHRRARSRRPA